MLLTVDYSYKLLINGIIAYKYIYQLKNKESTEHLMGVYKLQL